MGAAPRLIIPFQNWGVWECLHNSTFFLCWNVPIVWSKSWPLRCSLSSWYWAVLGITVHDICYVGQSTINSWTIADNWHWLLFAKYVPYSVRHYWTEKKPISVTSSGIRSKADKHDIHTSCGFKQIFKNYNNWSKFLSIVKLGLWIFDFLLI